MAPVNETMTTVVGNVITEVKQRKITDGTRVASFRMASNERRFDKETQQWVNGDSLFVTVTCWRKLALGVGASLVKGDPVMVTGLVRICRKITNRQLLPCVVSFVHRREGGRSEMDAFMGREVTFGADADEIVFLGTAEQIPILGADPYLNKLLVRYCEEARAHQASTSTFRIKVENAIAPLLPHGKASAPEISRRLGMSPRTLARQLAAEGVSMGAHTRSHAILTHLAPQECANEIAGSQEDLRREIGHVLPIFCYPSGRHNEVVIRTLKQAGFVMAFTTMDGQNHLDSADLLRLRRTNITPRTSMPIFKLRLMPAIAFTDQLRRQAMQMVNQF